MVSLLLMLYLLVYVFSSTDPSLFISEDATYFIAVCFLNFQSFKINMNAAQFRLACIRD